MKVSEIKQKGIEYCDSIKNNCVRCPLAEKICVSAPYGIIQMPDRKMDFEQFAKDFKYMISEIYDDIETADVQPVKHGHWVNCKAGFYHSFGECSECGHFTTMKHNYCPNCGARMVEPQESEDT